MGAGDAGAIMLRELQANPRLGLEVAGFLDDDRAKHGMRIHGVPVLGDRHDIPHIAARYQLRQLIIAIPTASGKAVRQIKAICQLAELETKIIPGIFELLDGTVSVSQLRDVEIEDLLRRAPVETDITPVRELIQGRRVLVTGAGGSIGGELCRQILHCRPAELQLLGHGENSIFTIYQELRRLESNSILRPVIADVRSGRRVQAIMAAARPDLIFHAAAHKHVPLMESNPCEAVTNNVLGTQHLLQAARAADVKHFVMISTDKAVNPTSVMGASKRVAELRVHAAAQESGRAYVTVRFGNVLGSRGSVVNTFKRQIAAGGPVTVTDPQMTRYFMTIPEAVQLVLQAAALGTGGEVFVLDMGEPVKIVDLAKDLISLSGLRLGRDIDVAFVGMRPGEKLFEELFVTGEECQRTAHEKIFIASNWDNQQPADLDDQLAALYDAAQGSDDRSVRDKLLELLPEYEPPSARPIGPAGAPARSHRNGQAPVIYDHASAEL
ncbi:MAG: nucleoside-diphosphate sugar epimerase/dehydratase, partial [Candidatus Promineifilaceae bacterium]|nr:nucleoside-diphosphate sugar epimerase/dehydratase [Candidatus Promineifilaceae bacterium]